MEEEKEKYLENSPIPISIKGTETIISQMKNGICKIYNKNGIKGTGFFCKICDQTKKNYLNVLITNNHILNENDIKIGSIIEFSLNDDNIYKKIKIDKDRKVFTDIETDATFIEIKPKEDKINFFFELDESIFRETEFLETFYRNVSVYILHYPKGENVMVSYGNIKQIKDKQNICHLCSIENGSSGSPILSLNNFKVLGVHYGSCHLNFNKGKLIKYPIIKFFGKNISNSLNELIKKKKEVKIPILNYGDYKKIKIEFISPNSYFSKFLQINDEEIYKYNKAHNISNEDFVINLYTTEDYIFLNNYLQKKIIRNEKYSEKEIKSWIWCLHKSLTNKSNVSNGAIFYRGQRLKFPEELKAGDQFIFGHFISVSPELEFAKMFAQNGTLFIIKIENNNKSNYYCKDITNLSNYSSEKEILITFNCIFEITKREISKEYEIINLTCLGYKND